MEDEIYIPNEIDIEPFTEEDFMDLHYEYVVKNSLTVEIPPSDHPCIGE